MCACIRRRGHQTYVSWDSASCKPLENVYFKETTSCFGESFGKRISSRFLWLQKPREREKKGADVLCQCVTWPSSGGDTFLAHWPWKRSAANADIRLTFAQRQRWGVIDGGSLCPLASCTPPTPQPPHPHPHQFQLRYFLVSPAQRRRGHKLISIVSWQVAQCRVFIIEQFLRRLRRVKVSRRRGVNYHCC